MATAQIPAEYVEVLVGPPSKVTAEYVEVLVGPAVNVNDPGYERGRIRQQAAAAKMRGRSRGRR